MAHSWPPDASGPGTEASRGRERPAQGRAGQARGREGREGPLQACGSLDTGQLGGQGLERGSQLAQPPTLTIWWCQNRTSCSHLTPKLGAHSCTELYTRVPLQVTPASQRETGDRQLRQLVSMCTEEHALRAWAHVCMCVQGGSLFSSSRREAA